MAAFLAVWGILSALMSQVGSLGTFLPLRFFIGAAEAGFFPGTILFMSYWVPAAHRSRFGAYFMLAIPLSIVVGGPVSGLILTHMHQIGGLQGWRWLFIVEGLPSVALALAWFILVEDRPENAAWLTTAERHWLSGVLRVEASAKSGAGEPFRWRSIFNTRVLLLCAVQAGCPAVSVGVTMWLPQVVKEFGLSLVQVGFICAVPFGVGAVAMWYWSSHSDRTGERRWHLTLSPLMTAAGLALSLATPSPLLKFACLLLASLGMFAFLPLVWAISHRLFTDAAAPVGYAIVNMGSAAAGFLSPYLLGVLKERTGTYEAGIAVLAIIGFLTAACAYRLLSPENAERARPALNSGSV
jgi:ACS family tartrate transporter-like MFS transporter